MGEDPILIIGAGIAGLSAAEELSRAGKRVSLMEARDRPGGRIYTLRCGRDNLPVELGAEFIHGKKNETWNFIRKARLKTKEVPDRHWQPKNGSLKENARFWDELDSVFGKLDPNEGEESFLSFLKRHKRLKPSAREQAIEYVEGFHAAPVSKVGICALAKANAAAEEAEGTRTFRIEGGYGLLVEWLVKRLARRRVQIHYHSTAKVIRWTRGRVEVEAWRDGRRKIFNANQVLLTVPIGVLKSRRSESVLRFNPRLRQKERAIQGLEMGHIMRVTLQFRSRFWPVKNFGFVHSTDPWWPTWWTQPKGNFLTGWAGASRVNRMEKASHEKLISEAVRALAAVFNVRKEKVRALLAASYMHDWTNDPFAFGAYSYTPVGMVDMPKLLATPIEQTLFFAGEATDSDGDQGTVSGALASGRRAAKEMLAESDGLRLF
jgi:monoamine oxidase